MEVTTWVKRRQSDTRAVMRKREAIEPREEVIQEPTKSNIWKATTYQPIW